MKIRCLKKRWQIGFTQGKEYNILAVIVRPNGSKEYHVLSDEIEFMFASGYYFPLHIGGINIVPDKDMKNTAQYSHLPWGSYLPEDWLITDNTLPPSWHTEYSKAGELLFANPIGTNEEYFNLLRKLEINEPPLPVATEEDWRNWYLIISKVYKEINQGLSKKDNTIDSQEQQKLTD
jgi:hypothetical protein